MDVAASAPVDSVPPLAALAPPQAPEAEQLDASVEPQVRVDALPAMTEVGFADNETVGAGVATVTVAVWLTDPLGPVQVSVKLVVAATGADASVPLVALGPFHPPEATQLVAFVELQLSVELLPAATAAGFAVSVTVVPGGATVMSTVLVVLPPAPEHVSPKLVDAVNAAVGSLPDVVLLPAHPPDAVQVAASDELQVRLEEAPEAMLAGFASKATTGAGVAPPDPVPPPVPPTSPIPPHPAVIRVQQRIAITERVLIRKNSTPAGGLVWPWGGVAQIAFALGVDKHACPRVSTMLHTPFTRGAREGYTASRCVSRKFAIVGMSCTFPPIGGRSVCWRNGPWRVHLT